MAGIAAVVLRRASISCIRNGTSLGDDPRREGEREVPVNSCIASAGLDSDGDAEAGRRMAAASDAILERSDITEPVDLAADWGISGETNGMSRPVLSRMGEERAEGIGRGPKAREPGLENRLKARLILS